MNDERQQILQMLQEGKITTEQAMELLEAIDTDTAPLPAFTASPAEPMVGEIVSEATPNMDRYRSWWQIPFFISLAVMVLFGFWLRALYQSADGALTFGFICVWSLFMLTVGLTTLAFLSRRAAWVHVRVQEKKGRRVAISLPLPLGIASWGINLARGFVDDATQIKLDMASEFVKSAKESMQEPGHEPLTIHVDDEDGDRVQVYIG